MTASLVPALLISAAALGGSPRGVLLDFSATWCQPCRQMNPIVSRLERQGYSIRTVDVDREPELARQFGVEKIPAFVLVVDGQEVTRITGATTEERLRQLLARIPSDPPPVYTTSPAASSGTGRPSSNSSLVELGEPAPLPGSMRSQPSSSPNAPVKTAAVEPETKPSLWGKLLGRRDEPKPPPQPEIVRGNDPAPEPASVLPVRNPVAASVRIHVTINGQTNVGSGTAIDSLPGRTVVTTCGHLFKGWNEQSKIDVDVFTDSGIQKFVGRMVHYDITADVGILTIPTDTIIATAEVPDVDGRLQEGAAAVNIGCSGGAPPTEEVVQVTALNYFEGPDNVECTGIPVQGRSGGGLFNRHGQLVGICIGADAQRQRGAYAGLLAIHDLLDASNLSELYRRSGVSPSPQSHAVAQTEATGAPAPRSVGEPEVPPLSMTEPLRQESAATLAQAQLAGAGAEVICIIRDRQQPGAPSRVVIIDRASPKFLSYLGAESAQTRMSLSPSSIQSNRPAPLAEPTDLPQMTDPPSVHPPNTSSRPLFSSPSDRRIGPQPRSEALQPTALAGPFLPRRYVRSADTRR